MNLKSDIAVIYIFCIKPLLLTCQNGVCTLVKPHSV